MKRRAALMALGLVLIGGVVLAAGALGGGGEAEEVGLTQTTPRPNPADEPGKFDLKPRPQVVEVGGAGGTPAAPEGGGDAPSPGAPSDAEVRAELKRARKTLADFRHYLNTAAFIQTGPKARVARGGMAVAPEDAPEVVKRVILAGNQIAKFPYKWGGGHGAWRDNGYDCSGSVSFALAGAGLLDRPLASGGFMDWGDAGPGRWITIYTNPGHMFMVVAGLRFDTSGQGRKGTRWQEDQRPGGGYEVRHPPGL